VELLNSLQIIRSIQLAVRDIAVCGAGSIVSFLVAAPVILFWRGRYANRIREVDWRTEIRGD
jgi:hypothetical protein